MVYFRPAAASFLASVIPGVPAPTIEFPFDTTRAIVSLLFAGTFTKQARQKSEKEDLPTYRERWLAERNGGEPSPETDGGSVAGVRELTDEIIGGMDLDEFKAVWDLKKDQPKPGYRYRSTRGIDPRAAQRAGHAQ